MKFFKATSSQVRCGQVDGRVIELQVDLAAAWRPRRPDGSSGAPARTGGGRHSGGEFLDDRRDPCVNISDE